MPRLLINLIGHFGNIILLLIIKEALLRYVEAMEPRVVPPLFSSRSAAENPWCGFPRGSQKGPAATLRQYAYKVEGLPSASSARVLLDNE